MKPWMLVSTWCLCLALPAQVLLQNAKVASVPGTAFFASEQGKRMLRFCFAKDFASLEEACKRLRAFKPAAV